MPYAKLKIFILKNKNSFFSFILVGLLTAGIYFSLFALLWQLLNLDYKIAVSIAYITAILFYFFFNRKFTFKNHTHSIREQFSKFIIMAFINYLATLAVIHIVMELLKLPPYFGMVIALGITTILSYLIAKFWVFQSQHQGEI